MSIAGKFLLLLAMFALVVMVVVYGGAPPLDSVPVENGSGVTGHVSGTQGADPQARTVAIASATPRVPETSNDQSILQSKLTQLREVANERVIEMGRKISESLIPEPPALAAPASPTRMASATSTAQNQPTMAPAKRTGRVVVMKGDTLTAISRRTLGEDADWRKFLDVNPGLDPRRLRPGQQLQIPSGELQAVSDRGSVEETRVRRHTVVSGDSLSSIALRYYGSANRWEDVFDANREALGGDPDNIREHVVLLLP